MIANCLGINEAGHLEISGCDTVRLAEQYGTPLYVMSEDEIRSVCRRYVASFAKNYNGNGKPIYASKAFSCKEIYRIVLSEGLDVEVVSGGELYTALQAGVPGSQIHFQGNNKSAGELTMAVENGVGGHCGGQPVRAGAPQRHRRGAQHGGAHLLPHQARH